MQPQQYGSYYNYGQVVVGPCGSGKTTYCNGMQQYLQLIGRKPVCVVNFDPANHYTATTRITNDNDDGVHSSDNNVMNSSHNKYSNSSNDALPYTTAVIYDVCVDAVHVSSVMKQMNLGPNGALLYCMEYLELHIDEIIDTIQTRTQQLLQQQQQQQQPDQQQQQNGVYYILDFPGQIELYTHSTSVHSILHKFTERLQLKLVVVQLMDASILLSDLRTTTKFISAALLGTATMIRLELPTVNVLSKMDLVTSSSSSSYIDQQQPLLPLDYFTDCHDLQQRLVPFLDDIQQQYTNQCDDDELQRPLATNDSMDDNTIDIMDDLDYQRIVQKRQSTPFHQRHVRLHSGLAEIVDDYSLLSYQPLDINSAESVGRVLAHIDTCHGYIRNNTPLSLSTTSPDQYHHDLFHCASQTNDGNRHYPVNTELADVREHMSTNIPSINTTTKRKTKLKNRATYK